MLGRSPGLRIRRATRDDFFAVEAWIKRDCRALIYHSPIFSHFLKACVGGEPAMWLAERNGELQGVLPWFTKRHPDFGAVINSLPWYGSHGGCLAADDDARAALLDIFRNEAAAPDVLSATLILSPYEQDRLELYDRILSPTVLDHRLGQISSLPAAGTDLEQRLECMISQKTRNLVRKSLKQGFTEVVTDDDDAWRFLHRTHVENMSAVGGRAKPFDHFEALQATLPDRRLSLAVLDGEPVAALLLLHFHRTVEYIAPVIRVEHRSRQPLSFLIWQAMIDAVNRNFAWWNWGGTWVEQTSLHHFKAGWGGVDHPYTYLVIASNNGIHRLEQGGDEVFAAFPYYYIYPRSALPAPPAAWEA
ncbi:MAG: GNAT family N-acetyltransferase [Rhodospirillaceae bacterium]